MLAGGLVERAGRVRLIAADVRASELRVSALVPDFGAAVAMARQADALPFSVRADKHGYIFLRLKTNVTNPPPCRVTPVPSSRRSQISHPYAPM